MIAYLFRRLFYGVLILLGVNLLTFLLFFAVNTPDDMARLALGGKRVSVESIEAWKSAHGYDLPLFWNEKAQGTESVTKTIFWTRSVPLLSFDFGMSDSGRDITTEIKTRMVPSLLLAVPTFLLGVITVVSVSLLVALLRGTRLEKGAIAAAVALMSISSLFYIITGQWLFGKIMQLVPVSGWSDGAGCVAFLALPVAIGVFAQLGSGTLLYRAMFLEELNKDYVRCVRAKGITETRILFGHVLRNASLPIVTSTGGRQQGGIAENHRRRQRPGLLRRARHGLFGNDRLHRGADFDRRRLHLGRSPDSTHEPLKEPP